MIDAEGGGRRTRGKAVLAGLALCGITGKAAATEFAYGLGYFAEHSSNISHVPTGERRDWVHSLAAGLALRDQGPTLATHIAAQTQLNRYTPQIYDNAFLSFVDAASVWAIAPRQLTWTLEDRYSEAQINAAAPDVPSNIVGANIADTGPDYFLRLGSTNTVVLGGRYGRMTFTEGNVDNNRISAHARWLYELDSTTVVSVNAEELKIVFDDDMANTNYKRTDSFLRYDARPSRSRIVIDLGSTRIDRVRGAGADGSLARLTWYRQVTSESTLSLGAAREFSDAGMQLQSTITNPVPSPNPTPGAPSLPLSQDLVTGDVFYTQRFEATYGDAGTRLGWTMQAFARHYDFELTPQDRREAGGRLEISLTPNAPFVPTLFGEFQRTRYLNLAREDEDRTAGVRFSERISRSLTLGFEGRRIARSSSDPNVDFIDRRVLFSVTYTSNLAVFNPARR